MSKTVCCPKCKSENIRSIDNQPLGHPSSRKEAEEKEAMRYDNEVYVEFICHECNPTDAGSYDKSFTVVFDMIPRI